MPSKSGPQHRAMEAAAHGSSTLGIPKTVGADFVKADKTAGRKFSTKAVADAVRKKRKPADIEAQTAKDGGYTSRSGVGSG